MAFRGLSYGAQPNDRSWTDAPFLSGIWRAWAMNAQAIATARGRMVACSHVRHEIGQPPATTSIVVPVCATPHEAYYQIYMLIEMPAAVAKWSYPYWSLACTSDQVGGGAASVAQDPVGFAKARGQLFGWDQHNNLQPGWIRPDLGQRWQGGIPSVVPMRYPWPAGNEDYPAATLLSDILTHEVNTAAGIDRLFTLTLTPRDVWTRAYIAGYLIVGYCDRELVR